jgi:transcriptional regulator with XRE-family HTH domain
MDDLFLALSPADVERILAARLRQVRQNRGWTQLELAKRSGLGLATVARLERTGQGQIASLTRLCAALGRLDDFEAFLRPAAPTTLDELRRRSKP